MARQRVFSDEEVLSLCMKHYEEEGYVQWSRVGRELGVNPNNIVKRLKLLVCNGKLSQEQFNKYAESKSIKWRINQDEKNRRKHYIVFSPQNDLWLRDERARTGLPISSLINGLVLQKRKDK